MHMEVDEGDRDLLFTEFLDTGKDHVHHTFEKGNLMYFLENAYYTKEIRQYNFNGKKRLSSYIENF